MAPTHLVVGRRDTVHRTLKLGLKAKCEKCRSATAGCAAEEAAQAPLGANHPLTATMALASGCDDPVAVAAERQMPSVTVLRGRCEEPGTTRDPSAMQVHLAISLCSELRARTRLAAKVAPARVPGPAAARSPILCKRKARSWHQTSVFCSRGILMHNVPCYAVCEPLSPCSGES